MYEIICPYCFANFLDSEVIFRANTGYTQDELDAMQTDFDMQRRSADKEQSALLRERRLFRRFDDENSFSADKLLDEKLIQFWASRGGASGYVNADPNWDYPQIDPADPERFKAMVCFEQKAHLTPDEDGFVRDRDGFIIRVVDKLSDPSRQMTRLCPHCHNPLPLPDYGKYPVIFISVVGITGAGKTVYLNQLLTKFATSMQNTGYRISTSNLSTINEVVMAGHALPGSTDDQTMRRPLAVNMTKIENSCDGMTIVFYDIAGENCVAAVDKDGKAKDNSTIGHFIAHCDGLMFLIDPEQVPIFSPVATSDVSSVQKVIDVVNVIRAGLNSDSPNWDDVPVAAVLTKSDLLRSKLTDSSLIFRHINYADDGTGTEKRGFLREEFIQIHRELSEQFQRNASSISDSMESFAQKAYFAVSAITCGVESRFEKYKSNYILSKENENKFKALRRWIRGWNFRNAEDRSHYSPCPVRDAEGGAITFPLDQAISRENGEPVITEIYAESIQDGFVDRIQLNLWEVAEEINLVGYPTANPNPRRIEEPVKWILWKLGHLEPYFVPEVPVRPFFCSNRKWEQIQEECRQRNIANRHAFYEGADL